MFEQACYWNKIEKAERMLKLPKFTANYNKAFSLAVKRKNIDLIKVIFQGKFRRNFECLLNKKK